MKTQQLGNTSEDVSALCLGAMYLGTRQDKATSFRLLDQYVEAGGTFIDTANIYSHWSQGGRGGESETLLGEWMRERRNRTKIFMASKVGFEYGSVPRSLKPELIEEECNKSLKRMGIETFDLYYAHVDDRATSLEDTMRAFERLVHKGKVRCVGASNYVPWRLEQAHWFSRINGWSDFCCVQQHYTYLQLRPGTNVSPQEFATDELKDYCRNTGMTLLAYSVLQSGAYTRDDRSFNEKFAMPDNQARLATVREIAAETGSTPNQVVLRWMRQSSPAIIPLIAASSEEQLRENIDALNADLSPEHMQRLNKAGLPV
ncbi:MAG: aldo/keto reductase [Burkholderiales bacterium]|nr:aldo/keto reductase [Anaerolineae bacterium]